MGKVLIDLESVKDKKIHRAWYKLTDEDGNVPVNTSNSTRGRTTSTGDAHMDNDTSTTQTDTSAAAGGVSEKEGASGPSNPPIPPVDEGDERGANTSITFVNPESSLNGPDGSNTTDNSTDSVPEGDVGTEATSVDPVVGVDKGLGSIEVILWWRHNEEIAAAVEAVELARAEANKPAGPNPHPHLNIRQDGLTHSMAVPLRRTTTDSEGEGGSSRPKSRSRFGFGNGSGSGSGGTGAVASSETQSASQGPEPHKGGPGSSLSFNVNAKVRADAL